MTEYKMMEEDLFRMACYAYRRFCKYTTARQAKFEADIVVNSLVERHKAWEIVDKAVEYMESETEWRELDGIAEEDRGADDPQRGGTDAQDKRK